MAHVCMVVEGAYPYITGGVSAWCHKLITDIKDVDFTLLVILPPSYRGKSYKYELPPNVKAVREIWLDLDYFKHKRTRLSAKKRKGFFDQAADFHLSMRFKNYGYFKLLAQALFKKNHQSTFCLSDLTRSRESIKSVFSLYRNFKNTSAFMHYFWTWKSTHLPIFKILNYPLPQADMYHAVSTGYAGLVSAVAKLKHGYPFVLTEHGIYAMEREDELIGNKTIKEDQKQFWINFFHGLCRLSYSFADKIITLYRGNLFIEVANNANVDQIEIIPNGVDLDFYTALKDERKEDRLLVAMVARVVPIKDVKTFIRAAHLVLEKMPNLDFYIIGPTDEDEEYFTECTKLAEQLGLKEKLVFTGKASMADYYGKIDILVLTSSREAQPLVLLEGMCAGTTCVSSDVGCCRDMLSDVGFITAVASPPETAAAILKLAANPQLRAQLRKKGKEMVKLRYNVVDVIDSYRAIYHKYSRFYREKDWTNGRHRVSAP